jgi:hypothetical protein
MRALYPYLQLLHNKIQVIKFQKEVLRGVTTHPVTNGLGNPGDGVRARSRLQNMIAHCAFLSQTEPQTFDEANGDPDWIMAMQEELAQFERNRVWKLVPRPQDRGIIGTRWVFRNQNDEHGTVVKNQARNVVFLQQKGIDYDETAARL